LTHLLQKDVAFDFDEKWLVAFRTLKSALVSAPIIQPQDWSQPFEIMCDASDYAVGAVLGQRKEGWVHVIYYASKTLNEAQLNYGTTEKEFFWKRQKLCFYRKQIKVFDTDSMLGLPTYIKIHQGNQGTLYASTRATKLTNRETPKLTLDKKLKETIFRRPRSSFLLKVFYPTT
jgi:hypothetical protein